jgi:HlyD family secretion protein
MTVMTCSERSVRTKRPSYAPYARVGYVSIATVAGLFGLWAASAPIDSAAIAPAKVSVESERKPIQHLEGGIIREIAVREAQTVHEGDVLFRLEPISARADSERMRVQYDAVRAQQARLTAEREGAAAIVFPAALLARANEPEMERLLFDERRQFDERMRLRVSDEAIYKARINQTLGDMNGRRIRAEATNAQLESFAAEMAAVAPLVDKGFFARNKFRAMEREKSRLEGEIGAGKGEMARLEQSVAETRLQMEQARQRVQEQIAQQLAETRAREADLREKLAVADDVLNRLEVRASRTGVVQNLKVFAAGAVVRPGETLAEIVPTGDSLILSARVSTNDIQSIAPGQKAEVRFPAFKRAAPIFGKVESVSADTLIDENTRQPFYAARVRIDFHDLPQNIATTLVPGMPADVLIATGERTSLQYLLAPVRDALSKSMRER